MQLYSTISTDLTAERDHAPASTHHSEPGAALLGESLLARRIRTQVQRVAPYLRTALVCGEPGSGKAQIARALHNAGPQRGGPFVECSAVTLAEAFFGERSDEDGTALLQGAVGGTLYLRGVDELAYPLQGSLQRFLLEREAMRLAATRPGRIAQPHREPIAELRLIAGSRRDLRTVASVGQFRPELYARLSVIEVRVPALRERPEDIPLIAEALLQEQTRSAGSACKNISPAALERLRVREWPGNLRELQKVLNEAVALAAGAVIQETDLPRAGGQGDLPDPAAVSGALTSGDRLETVVQRHILQVLTRCRGNKLRAAEVLGISRSTLYRMLDAGAVGAQAQPAGD